MFDESMWLPGFAPVAATPGTTADAAVRKKPLSSEIEAVVNQRPVWPESADGVRELTPSERYQANLAAIRLAGSLDGAAPTAEQAAALNLFSGWGALSTQLGASRPEHKEIASVIGEKAMAACTASVTTGFFTLPAVARAIWGALVHAGFRGGNVLDPAAGHGAFLAAMPRKVAARSQVTAIEPEPATFSVLRALYGSYGVNLLNSKFEEAKLPVGFFDAVVTNVPFGDFGVGETRNVVFRKFLIHDYFLARAFEVVRPGGLVAVITSSGTMAKATSRTREYFSAQAKLVAAIKLPVEAFKHAGTSVSADVLVFKRLADGEAGNGTEWTSADCLTEKSAGLFARGQVPYSRFPVENVWFAKHHEDVLGKFVRHSTQYQGATYMVESCDDWMSALQDRLQCIPPDTYHAAQVRVTSGTEILAPEGLLPGSFTTNATGDLLAVNAAGSLEPAKVKSGADTKMVLDIVAVRDALNALLRAQIEADDVAVATLRGTLNAAYDSFVNVHGRLGNCLAVFRGDPSIPALRALEMDQGRGKWSKAAIFDHRTVNRVVRVEHCDTPEEALKVCLALHGRVDPSWIGRTVNGDPSKVMETLAHEGLVFQDPKTQAWVTTDAYLSGNVREKLAEAIAAGPQWADNANALKAVVPADVPPQGIRAGLGSSWIPANVYAAFTTEVFGVTTRFSHSPVVGGWSVDCSEEWKIAKDMRDTYGVKDAFSPIDLVRKAMNQQEPTVRVDDPRDSKRKVVDQVRTIEARAKQGALREQFVKWLWSDTGRSATLSRIYNDAFNSIVDRTFDGSHLTLPGFSNVYDLYAHQKNGIWRVVTSDVNTLLGHRVGFGKSLDMICGGMELKRIGAASKIAYVVPNATLGDFVMEFVKAYPTARLLVATEDEFTGDNRRNFLAKAAMGDWDGVVITHTAFERIRVGEEAAREFKERQTELLTAAAASGTYGVNGTLKQVERLKAKWSAALARAIGSAKRDEKDSITFESIGFDWLMVDEAHYFKNLFRFSRMSRVAGLPDSDSARAFDMLLKVRLVMEKRGDGRGIVFATGTPIANSIAEMFTMQRFLQQDELERIGCEAFDSWAANFGEVVTGLEVAPDGSGYRMNRRFSRFVNVPELMASFCRVADVQVGCPPGMVLPAVQREVVVAKPSDCVKAYVQSLVERAELIHKGGGEKNDNMLAITGDGRKAALDMRLIDPAEAEDPDGKLNLCVRNVHRIWADTTADRSTQLVFCDMGVNSIVKKGGVIGFSVYETFRSKLISLGVPEDEIAFAQDANSHAARSKQSEAVRAGRIRIVLGSTTKLGVGRNVQTRLVALHHLDAPWRPADIEQREGRGIRQGNKNGTLMIFRYVTEGSFDAYVWQTLETKAKFVAQVMSGDRSLRYIEDLAVAALSYSEVKALASGNPMVMEKAGVDSEVATLAALRSAHGRIVAEAKTAVVRLPKVVAGIKAAVEDIRASMARMPAQRGKPMMSKGVLVAATPAEIGQHVASVAIRDVVAGGAPVTAGMIGDLRVTIYRAVAGKGFILCAGFDGCKPIETRVSGSARSATLAIENAFSDQAWQSRLADEEAYLKRREADLAQSEIDQNAPFSKEDRYHALLQRQAEINAELGVDEGELEVAYDE